MFLDYCQSCHEPSADHYVNGKSLTCDELMQYNACKNYTLLDVYKPAVYAKLQCQGYLTGKNFHHVEFGTLEAIAKYLFMGVN